MTGMIHTLRDLFIICIYNVCVVGDNYEDVF